MTNGHYRERRGIYQNLRIEELEKSNAALTLKLQMADTEIRRLKLEIKQLEEQLKDGQLNIKPRG